MITISGFIVIPLFGKIQNRILELMKLFFTIDLEIKGSIITRIQSFQNTYFRKNLETKVNTRINQYRSLEGQISSNYQFTKTSLKRQDDERFESPKTQHKEGVLFSGQKVND